jgi:hypothetical protein
MPFTEDFSDFINQDTPGYVELSLLGNDDVPAIFDKNYQGSFDMNGSEPVLHIAESNLGAAEQGTPLVIVGDNYKIANIEPDGSGIALVRLKKA